LSTDLIFLKYFGVSCWDEAKLNRQYGDKKPKENSPKVGYLLLDAKR
jgi:hypothetical protein